MSLEDIHKHIQAAEQELAKLVEEEQQQRTGKAMMYVFVYEQQFSDAPGEWGPNSQIIEAYDVQRAFNTFGYVIKQFGLTVRNINYGTYNEMQGELERIRNYWSKHHEKRGGKI